MGRPEKPIDWDEVEKRLEAGNSVKTICNKFGIKKLGTFYDRFKNYYGENFSAYSVNFKPAFLENIAYSQYKSALDGNTSMLILLGQEHLNQGKEKVQEPPKQHIIDQEQKIMFLENELAIEKEKNANKSETE